jgi:hypothetical protein
VLEDQVKLAAQCGFVDRVTIRLIPPCSVGLGTTANTERGGTEIRHQTSQERSVEVSEAEDAPTSRAGSALEDIDSTAALVAIGSELGFTENAELCHLSGAITDDVRMSGAQVLAISVSCLERCASIWSVQSDH